jgi:hypothetical protein
MKRFIGLILVAAIATTGVFLWHPAAKADSSAPMTEAHIARIRNNCVEAQSTLYQLHASDAVLRVNRGQLYESISTKLMAPFNSRVTLKQLDGVNLVTIATNYDRQLSDFRSKYQQYEEAMTTALNVNCKNQPVAFYDAVTDARNKRQLVHDSTAVLQKTIQDYKNEFEVFAKTFPGGN